MQTFLNVRDMSEALGVSNDTIRRWEKAGLIKGSRDSNNYRVFDLEEVKRLQNKLLGTSLENNFKILISPRKTQFKTIELFTGTGGTALGLENAGLNNVLMVEIEKNAVATLNQNRPKWNVVHDDIKNVDFSKYKGKIDVVEGGFPCQSFSYAGKKKGFGDIRGTLFFQFARCVKEVMPKIAVGENVKGLLKHDEGRTLKTMVKALEEIGYDVAYKVLRSQYLDVPQKRERLIIIAVRKDLDIPIAFPKEKDYTVSLREALKNVPPSDGQKYPEKKKAIMDLVPAGCYWRSLPESLQKSYLGGSFFLGGGKTGIARRLSWDEPSLTLTCAPAQKQTERCHPEETRPLTVREYARIQTFPDEWVFMGPTSAKYKQIGNAVPVNLGYHIGTCLIAMLENKVNPKTMEIVEPLKEDTLNREAQESEL